MSVCVGTWRPSVTLWSCSLSETSVWVCSLECILSERHSVCLCLVCLLQLTTDAVDMKVLVSLCWLLVSLWRWFVRWFSCQFHGTATELASHVEDCPYEAVKHFIHRTEGRFTELVEILQQKDQEINFLRAMLGQLSTKVESLEKTVEGLHWTGQLYLCILLSYYCYCPLLDDDGDDISVSLMCTYNTRCVYV